MQKIWQQFYDRGVPANIDYPTRTLYELFEDAVARNPSGAATLFFGARIRYAKLGRLVDRFASALAALGVQQGDRVALVLPNLPAYPIAHFAVLKLGGILVPTNPLYVERELEKQLNDSGAETVVILDQLFPRLEKVRDRTSVRRIILVQIKDFLPRILGWLFGLKEKSPVKPDERAGIYRYRDLIRRPFPSVRRADAGPEDIAILLYTGGTTGISKGAVLTHRNLVVNVHQTRAWLADMQEGKEILLCVLPFFHSYGMTTGMHLAVLARSTMLLVPRFDLKDVLKRIKKHRPTIFCGVPSMYNAINHSPHVSSGDVSSIKLCISGGAALPAEVQKSFEELTGGKLVEGYGLSETSPVAIVNPIHGHRKSGTIGVPIADTDVQIVDPESRRRLPQGEVGELTIRGPQVMKEYWKMPEETERVLQGGWLYTGDMAVMDEEGFVSIVDRKKDVIISAGMNVFPREVEEVLHQHPKIVEAAVIGVPSTVREEVVKAYLVVKEGERLSKSEVIQYCRDKLAKFKIPKEVEFRRELPKSALGKVLKRELREAEKKTSTTEDTDRK